MRCPMRVRSEVQKRTRKQHLECALGGPLALSFLSTPTGRLRLVCRGPSASRPPVQSVRAEKFRMAPVRPGDNSGPEPSAAAATTSMLGKVQFAPVSNPTSARSCPPQPRPRPPHVERSAPPPPLRARPQPARVRTSPPPWDRRPP